ncbi:hypothetical protein [Microcoleus phage My-WqHQDG]|nr:hypothetical protein [Microcoleus phage My-WqHQDG]
MGEANRRKVQDPLYGVVPKTGVMSPLWVLHKGVLFLVGQGDSIACLPAGNRVTPNVEQLKVLEDILSSNPSLMVAAAGDTLPAPTLGTIDMTNGSAPTTVTTITLK